MGLIGYSLGIALLALVAGMLCARGRSIGRMLAFIPALLLLFNFPLGTLFAIGALIKLNKREFVRSLQ